MSRRQEACYGTAPERPPVYTRKGHRESAGSTRPSAQAQTRATVEEDRREDPVRRNLTLLAATVAAALLWLNGDARTYDADAARQAYMRTPWTAPHAETRPPLDTDKARAVAIELYKNEAKKLNRDAQPQG